MHDLVRNYSILQPFQTSRMDYSIFCNSTNRDSSNHLRSARLASFHPNHFDSMTTGRLSGGNSESIEMNAVSFGVDS